MAFNLRKEFSSVRARIFLWYCFLLFLFLGISVPLIFSFVAASVQERVTEDLNNDMGLFKGILRNDPTIRAELEIDDIDLPVPTTPSDLVTYFNLYFSRRLPEDDTFFIGVIDQEFYRSTPEALPTELAPSSPLFESLIQTTQEIEGADTSEQSTVGNILYQVKPILVSGPNFRAFHCGSHGGRRAAGSG